MSENGRPKDVVFYAIRREYRSQVLALSRGQERRAELKAQLAQAEESIERARSNMEHLLVFSHEQGWSTRDLDKG